MFEVNNLSERIDADGIVLLNKLNNMVKDDNIKFHRLQSILPGVENSLQLPTQQQQYWIRWIRPHSASLKSFNLPPAKGKNNNEMNRGKILVILSGFIKKIAWSKLLLACNWIEWSSERRMWIIKRLLHPEYICGRKILFLRSNRI